MTNPSGYMTCLECGDSLTNPLRDLCYRCDQELEAAQADDSSPDWEMDEPMHGPDCIRRAVEDHAVAMGRAAHVTDGTGSRPGTTDSAGTRA
jgi:hypothetical protein